MGVRAEYSEAVIERVSNTLRKADSIEFHEETSMSDDGSVKRTTLLKVVRTVHQAKPVMGFKASDTPKT